MTEIPEHLRKRAEEARKKAAAKKAEAGDTPAEETPADADADAPAASKASPRGPYKWLVRAWLAMAPTPVRMNGTRAPQANALVATAMPTWPVASS